MHGEGPGSWGLAGFRIPDASIKNDISRNFPITWGECGSLGSDPEGEIPTPLFYMKMPPAFSSRMHVSLKGIM